MNLTSIHKMWVWSLASLSGLRIRHCCELWCRSQTQLRPGVAVAVVWACGYNSDSTPSLGTSTCCKCGPKIDQKKQQLQNQKKKKKSKIPAEPFRSQASTSIFCDSAWRVIDMTVGNHMPDYIAPRGI